MSKSGSQVIVKCEKRKRVRKVIEPQETGSGTKLRNDYLGEVGYAPMWSSPTGSRVDEGLTGIPAVIALDWAKERRLTA